MTLTTRYKGFKLVTMITKNSKYTMAHRNGVTRFVGNLEDCINYIDSITAV